MKNLTKLFFFTALGLLFFAGDFDAATQFGFSVIQDAEARLGRPLSPVSVAGVHRRTRRRTAAVTAAIVTRPVVVTHAVGSSITVLPTGCTILPYGGVNYHSCGGIYYRPAFQGNVVIYQVVNAP